ncbi:sensor histidine kinase [Sorangium cellulosum]|uniref:sensor histidine kinase n=1 Tax=Sorangium cellulosum TaxID=56 RepID=UPI000CF4ADF8|nr:ATP-binding protein [Sorangium cellulosum]
MPEEALTEAQFLRDCEAHQTRYALCHYQILKAMCLTLHGRPADALRVADEAEENLGFLAGKFQTAALRFYRALAIAALLPAAEGERRERLREDLDACRERLRGWTQSCPANFEHKHLLVEAETARVDGRVDDAARLYEQAITSARQHAFVNIEAVACELAGRFWMSRGRTRTALDFLTDAIAAYDRAGQDRKVSLLVEEFPLTRPARDGGAARAARADVFDVETLLKAARVLSQELVVERLLASMVQVLVESAGAERGTLLLVRGDSLVLVAKGVAHPPEFGALPSVPLEDAGAEVCAAAVRLAVRTRQTVISADASQDPAFRDDPYVSASKVRSMLCAPLLLKGRALGAIYLENNLFEGLFGPERLEILHLLAAQSAVSFNNALVYENLEKMVEERTRELQRTQQKLVDAARKAGMAEVADSAMHNVGNALNSVMVLRMQLSERLAGSRIARLAQVAQLLKSHQHDLAAFLESDPRGQRLIDYVDELSRHLAAENQAAAGEVAELGECVSRIRDIVSDQLRNAGMKIIVEPVVVAAVVEDALRVGLNRAERTHHGIEVVCELSDEVRIETDRHRLLQIVTNLVTNARRAVCHAVGPARRVLVRCAPTEGGGCSVEIEDTGVGIASDHLARLFQQGFTTWPEGTGLGLHSSVLEARLLGAALRAESKGPGHGAKFTLELPATAPRRGSIHAEATR